ncbi:MAG: hypothetical protein K2G13_01605, partial [Muribaculaceae bacterium]|nr:hypothetical protein [Muribaculaceae bacterium]
MKGYLSTIIGVAMTVAASSTVTYAKVNPSSHSETPMAAALADSAGYNKFRFGGYGEMVASFKDYGINRFAGTSTGSAKT